jgi:Ca2+-binding EF-hand superfamily protein
MAAKALSPE